MILLYFTVFMLRCYKRHKQSTVMWFPGNRCTKICKCYHILAFFTFFVFTCVLWGFIFPEFEPEYSDTGAADFCDMTLYYLAFVCLMITAIVVGLIVLAICCVCFGACSFFGYMK